MYMCICVCVCVPETNNPGWYNVGSNYVLDSSKPFTVVTQFHASSGTLSNITRLVDEWLHSRSSKGRIFSN